MTKTDDARRAFLIGAVVGVSTVAGGGLAADANAQDQRTTEKAAPPRTLPNSDAHGAFFNDEHAAALEAFAERLMPGAPGKPGARDTGVLNYIDLALAGSYSSLQDFYRRGLAQLDTHCRTTYNRPFARLTPAQQDEAITALEQGKATGFTWPSAQAFFNTVRTHTMEGMFADPLYGGNKDFAGWELVGFPGTQPLYTPGDLGSKEAFTRAPITGLQSQIRRA